MSSWLSWLMGGSSEPTKEQVIAYATKFYVDQGVWLCYIRQDIASDYLRKYLILFLKDKEFQAISTGPHSTTFQQDNSKRRCASVFSVVEGRKRVKFEYYEGDTLDPMSSTSVFFQSVLLELASKMADDGVLLGQPQTELAELPNSLSMVVDENSFMNPQERYWVAFLRSDAVAPARHHIQRYFEKSRFTLDDGSQEGDMKMSNHDLYLHVHAVVGYNSKNDLLVHVVFSSLPRESYEEDDEEEDEEEESEEETPDRVQVAVTGDPQLRQGNYEYFHSLLLGLGQQLAEQQLLRSQSGAFSKRTSSGAVLPPGQFPPRVFDNDDAADNGDDDEEEDEDEDDEDEDEESDDEEENEEQAGAPSPHEPPVAADAAVVAAEEILDAQPENTDREIIADEQVEDELSQDDAAPAETEPETAETAPESPVVSELDAEQEPELLDEVVTTGGPSENAEPIQVTVTAPPDEEEPEIPEDDSALFNSGLIDTRSFEFDQPSPDRVSEDGDEEWNDSVQ